MDIFHYVAHKTRKLPLFECGNVAELIDQGAIYNDHDFNASALVENVCDDEFSFSQSTNITLHPIIEKNVLVPQEAIDHAVMEADKSGEPCLYEMLAIDHELYDIESNLSSHTYLEKVYHLIVYHQENILSTPEKTVLVYEMRQRTNWTGSDTFYDAWILLTEKRRKGFPYHKFKKEFGKDWRNALKQQTNAAENEEESEEESKENIKKFVPLVKANVDAIIVISDDSSDNE